MIITNISDLREQARRVVLLADGAATGHEHDVGRRDELGELGVADPFRDRHDADFGIDGGEPPRRRFHLGRADVLHREQDLPLQIREIHDVGVHERERADARARQELRNRIAEAPGSDDQRARGREARLRVHSQLVEQEVAAVA